jgi:hypothetical protein
MSDRSLSIVPSDAERDIYLVLDDFGHTGRAWRETDEADIERAGLIQHLFEGQHTNPVRVVAFNTAEGWSREATDEIVRELRAMRR